MKSIFYNKQKSHNLSSFTNIYKYKFYFKRKRSSIELLDSQVLGKKAYNSYKIKLIKIGCKKKSFFKIVVVNWNNRYIDLLGFFNPHLVTDVVFFRNFVDLRFNRSENPNSLYLKLLRENELFYFKTISLNFEKVFFWISKNIVYTSFIHKILLVLFVRSINYREFLDYEVEYAEKKNKIRFFDFIYSGFFGVGSEFHKDDDVVSYIKKYYLGVEINEDNYIDSCSFDNNFLDQRYF